MPSYPMVAAGIGQPALRPFHVARIHEVRIPGSPNCMVYFCAGEFHPSNSKSLRACSGRTPKFPDSSQIGRAVSSQYSKVRGSKCRIIAHIFLKLPLRRCMLLGGWTHSSRLAFPAADPSVGSARRQAPVASAARRRAGRPSGAAARPAAQTDCVGTFVVAARGKAATQGGAL